MTQTTHLRAGLRGCCLGMALLLTVTAQATASSMPTEEALFDADIESLMSLQVSTVARKQQALIKAPAAVHVIQGSTLRALGITTLPEALRLAPGLHVAALNSQDYAVNARGLNTGNSSNKLEVLIDGRSIYTPLFSGVLWDQQIALIEDIERIEVIRGPAGAVWGANAVNGVINIVTRHAADTTGGALLLSAGDALDSYAGGRVGLALGERLHARLYALAYELDFTRAADGSANNDAHQPMQAGFRTDWAGRSGGGLTLQGDAFDITAGDGPVETRIDGGNLLASWRSAQPENQWAALAYFDDYTRDTPNVFFEHRQTRFAELQRRWVATPQQDWIFGVNYRRTTDRTDSSRAVSLQPEGRSLTTVGALTQLDYSPISQRWNLIAGLRYEHNDLTGDEWQPSVRGAVHLSEQSTLWASASRAVRVPTRLERDGQSFISGSSGALDGIVDPGGAEPPEDPSNGEGGGTIATLFNSLFSPLLGNDPEAIPFGNPDFDSEELIAFETGYRTLLADNWSLDLTAFVHDYERLASSDEDGVIINGAQARTQGLEASLHWSISDRGRAHLFWTLLDTRVETAEGNQNAETRRRQNSDPSGYGGLRVEHDLPAQTRLNLFLRRVEEIPSMDVPAYTELDLTLLWRPAQRWTLRLSGHNLLNPSHTESGNTRIQRHGTLSLEARW